MASNEKATGDTGGAEGTTPNSNVSLSSNGEGTSASARTPQAPKRKVTDLNLEIITIDKMYDLTLIVGTPEHPRGQKAFRVNKGSFRNASNVWTAMLSGNWAESNRHEISFPDDSCEAFLLVLRIAHLQFSLLPESLTKQELLELAEFTDKYNLSTTVQAGIEVKKWMAPHKGNGAQWSVAADLPDFALITHVFNLKSDSDYLINRLAMECQVDSKDAVFYYGLDGNKIRLRSGLPPKSLLNKLRATRRHILQEIIQCCSKAVDVAAAQKTLPCNNFYCPATKVGVMVAGLVDSGIQFATHDPSMIHRSVLQCWCSIKDIGIDYHLYAACTKTHKTKNHYPSTCSFQKCFGDFGFINKVREIVESHVHEDLLVQWKSAGYI